MDGTKVFIDATLLGRIDRTNPPGLTRTAWVSMLLEIGLVNNPLPDPHCQHDESSS
jgi:hypothetical protein